MKYNSIGEQLVAKAKELDPSYKPDKFNDMSEAINIILNNSGSESIFDITPYMTSLSTISVEGYNALREFVTNNKGGIVNANLGDNILSFCLSGILEDSLQFIWCNPYENSEYDVGYMRVIISSNGHLTIDNLILNQVLANPTESATESLSKVRIGNSVYDIPKGGFFNIFEYYDDDSDKITQEGWNKLSSGLVNGTYCGILYDELPLIVSGFNGDRTLYTFTTTEEENNIHLKLTLKSDLTYSIEEIPNNDDPIDLYLDITPYLISGKDKSVSITQEGANLIKTKIENDKIIGISSNGMNLLYEYRSGLTFVFTKTFTEDERKICFAIDTDTLMCTSEWKTIIVVPNLPEDANTKTYVLKSVNGKLTWSE